MNHPDFHNITDPYRFKKTIAWTFRFRSTMERYMNPADGFRMDGQLVGASTGQYLPITFIDLDTFDLAISTYAATQRKADRTDIISFWERSGSDYVSGELIHVNNVDANGVDQGAHQTGAKWEAFRTVAAGVNAASVNAANPPPKILISTKSNYNASPASTYSGGTRISKRCRLEKLPGAGSVRISQ